MEFTSKARLENGCIIAEVIAPAADENTKYAYYLYEKTQGLLEKRMYTSNPTCSFQPPCSGTYYVKTFVRHWPNGDKGDFTTTSQKTNNVSAYSMKPLSYEDLDAERFQKSGSTLYTILWDGVRFEFLINYRPGSSRAVVFGTGKVSGDIRPVFPVPPGQMIYRKRPFTILTPPSTWGTATWAGATVPTTGGI